MSKLTKDDIEKVALLAKLPLSPSELEKFSDQLSDVISYISTLSEVNTDKVEPTSQTTGLTNNLRPDVTTDSLKASEALSGSRKTHNGYFVVDAVLNDPSS